MNLVELKSPKDVTIDGVVVSFVTQDKSLKEISFQAGGKKFVVKRSDAYSENIKVFRVDEYTTERKFVLEGEMLGVKVCEIFADSYTAERRKADLENKAGATLKLEERDIKIDDLGNVCTAEPSDFPF